MMTRHRACSQCPTFKEGEPLPTIEQIVLMHQECVAKFAHVNVCRALRDDARALLGIIYSTRTDMENDCDVIFRQWDARVVGDIAYYAKHCKREEYRTRMQLTYDALVSSLIVALDRRDQESKRKTTRVHEVHQLLQQVQSEQAELIENAKKQNAQLQEVMDELVDLDNANEQTNRDLDSLVSMLDGNVIP
jgi:CRISPR/Cas system CSM-associated protein Csm2 small subunit